MMVVFSNSIPASCLAVAMGWRPAWCFILLVLTGTSVYSQQDMDNTGPLDKDYTTLPHDYPVDNPVDYHYDDVEFIPYPENTTLYKCRCDGDQIWDGTQCKDSPTTIYIMDNSWHRALVNTSDISIVEIGEVTCPDGHKKLVLDYKDLFNDTNLLEYGGLFWSNIPVFYYCLDHTLDSGADNNSIVVHLCLPPPPVPLCCPYGHALLPNGTCYPDGSSLNVPLAMKIEEREMTWEMTWEIEGNGILTNVTCNPDDTYYRRLTDANVTLVYDPRGAMLQWLPPTLLPHGNKYRDEYCVGVEVGGPGEIPQYSTLFCYKDMHAAHNKTCHNATCVRKCCSAHTYMHGVDCVSVHDPSMEWTPVFHHKSSLRPNASPPSDLAIVHGFPLCAPVFKLDDSEDDKSYLLQDGSLFVPSFDKSFPPTEYCLDNFIADDHPLQQHPLLCFEGKSTCLNVQSKAYPVLLAVSCVFLAVTLLVYVSVPELHAKVHGKCLVSHVTALLLAYLCLIIVQSATGNLPLIACKIMASLTHVSFLAAFFWLNVMCFDIWWTLKSMRPVAETGELSRLRFKMYSIYSWGCPAFISLVAIIVDSLPEDFDVVRPGFGTKKCWFADNHPLWAYFYGFVLTLVIANIILFCQVAYILIMAQNDPILQRTRQQNRERMWLYIKLFVVMGLTWIMEVISWQEGSCEAWIIPDVINALQGFSIFLIFICKRNMLKRIRNNWEPYLRRMKLFVGSSRQPDLVKGKGVQDTSSFTSSVNRPSSQSGASQRTVQSQISLDTSSAARKLSTSSLVSTTGVQVHSSNSLCMDTITEHATSEAEEMSQDEASCVPEVTQIPPPQDASTTAQSEATVDQEDSKQTEEPPPLETTETEATEEDKEDISSDTPASENTVDATPIADQTETENTTRCDVESVTPQEHYNRAYITDDLEEQPIQV